MYVTGMHKKGPPNNTQRASLDGGGGDGVHMLYIYILYDVQYTPVSSEVVSESFS